MGSRFATRTRPIAHPASRPRHLPGGQNNCASVVFNVSHILQRAMHWWDIHGMARRKPHGAVQVQQPKYNRILACSLTACLALIARPFRPKVTPLATLLGPQTKQGVHNGCNRYDRPHGVLNQSADQTVPKVEASPGLGCYPTPSGEVLE